MARAPKRAQGIALDGTLSVEERAVARRRSVLRALPDGLWTLVFLAPYLIGLAIFIALPTGASLLASFTNWPIFGHASWTGTTNYSALLASSDFWQAVRNTIYYVVLLVPAEIVVAIGLALLVNQKLRGVTLFRAIYFAPFVLSLAAIGLIWSWILSPGYGLVDGVLKLVGLPQPQWLADPSTAMPALVLTSLWRNAGYYMVIFLAGLQAVPEELYEAARIDGAGRWSQFRHITWPLLTPTTFFAVIIGVILGFQVFDLTYLMTQGGPAGATTTMVFFTYITAFQRGALGYASAAGFALLVMMLLFTSVYFYMERRWVHYAAR